VQVTYLLHLWVVLVLTMVQSRPHHLRHQWSQISTFVFLNHIRHHTYFKSSYVHIQVFHILHHHTMKLLLAFKSFLPREAYCRNRQRELVRCRLPNSTARTGSLQAANLAAKTILLPAASSTAICCRQLHIGSESQVHCRTRHSEANC